MPKLQRPEIPKYSKVNHQSKGSLNQDVVTEGSKSKKIPRNEQNKSSLNQGAAAEGNKSKKLKRKKQYKGSLNKGSAEGSKPKKSKRNEQNKPLNKIHEWKDYRANISKFLSLLFRNSKQDTNGASRKSVNFSGFLILCLVL